MPTGVEQIAGARIIAGVHLGSLRQFPSVGAPVICDLDEAYTPALPLAAREALRTGRVVAVPEV